MTSRRIIVLTLLLLSPLAVGFCGRPRPGIIARDEVIDRVQASAAGPRASAEQVALEGRLFPKTQRTTPAASPEGAATVADQPSSEGDPQGSTASLRQVTELDAEAAAALDTEFFADSANIEEGERALDIIGVVLGTLNPSGELLDVRCAQSRCRVLLWHAGESEQLTAAERIRSAAALGVYALHRHAPYAGALSTVLYVDATTCGPRCSEGPRSLAISQVVSVTKP
jgi:hypothetical protein